MYQLHNRKNHVFVRQMLGFCLEFQATYKLLILLKSLVTNLMGMAELFSDHKKSLGNLRLVKFCYNLRFPRWAPGNPFLNLLNWCFHFGRQLW